MTAARWMAPAVAAVLCVACAGEPKPAADPALRATGSESSVAVTVPAGHESIPQFVRTPEGSATLAIPSDLLFATDSADVGPAAEQVLAQVVDEVRRRGGPVPVLVEGYADADGAEAHNQALSERRATAVAGWLAAHGVPPDTLTTRGWGESRPAVAGDTDEAKAANRRVVVTVG